MSWLYEAIDLKAFNTLGFAVKAQYFCQLQALSDITRARNYCQQRQIPWQ